MGVDGKVTSCTVSVYKQKSWSYLPTFETNRIKDNLGVTDCVTDVDIIDNPFMHRSLNLYSSYIWSIDTCPTNFQNTNRIKDRKSGTTFEGLNENMDFVELVDINYTRFLYTQLVVFLLPSFLTSLFVWSFYVPLSDWKVY